MKKLVMVAIAAMSMAPVSAKVVINEIMQSNIDLVTDDLNQFPDSWVELYNDGNEAVNLGSYSVGDTDDASKAWQLPSQMLGPHRYQIVYCDKEGSGWHAPFRLDSGKGCAFYVFCNGKIEDSLPEGMKKQPAPNTAYGRTTDGADTWGYQLQPTPGNANGGGTCGVKDVLEPPTFSVTGKVYDGQPFELELSLPAGAPEGAEIRYTTDGSEPTPTSKRYTSHSIKISGTKVVRAKTFCDGYLSARSATHSYIEHGRDVTLPVISIVTDPRYLYDDKQGILVEGKSSDGKKNYEHDWRRPMNFEMWDGDLEHSFINQLGEARVAGAASRGCALKSLAIYANKRFGEKRFSHEFFPDQRPGLTEYKSLLLRNAGNDFDYLYMRDAIIQKHMAQYVDLDWQAYCPAIIYINGEYKGMLNIRERSNEDNIYTNYGGLEDIDMVENNWEQKEGDIGQWYDFQNFYREHGHTWEEFDQRMDVSEYLDVMILNLYYCNLDFPGNNIVTWKPQTAGGRWRVLVKDTDFGIGLYGRDANYQVLRWLYDPNYDTSNNWAVGADATRLFRRLMEDEKAHRTFIDRFAVYMGDFMNHDRTWETWEPMYERIRYEYPHHRELFNPWWPTYTNEVADGRAWLKARTPNMYRQLAEYYDLGKPVPLTVGTVAEEGLTPATNVSINGISLSRDVFDGRWFAGRELTLEADGAERWVVTVISPSGRERTEHQGRVLHYTPNEEAIKTDIRAVVGNPEIADPVIETKVNLYSGAQEIDWWDNAVWFGQETFPDFQEAASVSITVNRPNQNEWGIIRLQALKHDWSTAALPGQINAAGGSLSEHGNALIYIKNDGTVEFDLTEADKALIDTSLAQKLMLVGGNAVITDVTLTCGKSGIADVTVETPVNDGPTYNLLGVPVDESYRGFVIRNGHKYLQR